MTNESKSKASQPPPRWLLKALTWINVLVYRLTAGRMMNRFGGRDICLVKMTGAKSGRRRFIPLMYVPYEDGVLLVASQGGAPRHPVWYHNLVAHPDIEVRVHGKNMKVHARIAGTEEKAKVWPTCVEHYPPYDDYQAITTRDIPVFICKP